MKPVVVVGAGIGGLTLAAGLTRRGVPVVVLERAERLAAVGAGLTLQPNAVLALRRLGLAEPLEAAGARLASAALYDARGRVLARPSPAQTRELFARAGAPALGLHRATIHDALVAQLETLRLGARVTAVEDGAVTLAGGEVVHGSVVVGADGLSSTVRAALLGPAEPRYSGYFCWRGVTAGGAFPRDWAAEYWGAGQRFGGCAIDGDRRYWFLVANGPPGADPGVAHVAAAFPAEVQDMIRDTPPEAIRRDDISDRPPAEHWGFGAVTLLGDAAHPMTPNLGQGACQVIEDALVLTELIGRDGPGPDTLRAYERVRRPRANALVTASYRLGRVAQAGGPVAPRLRDTLVRMVPAGVMVRQMRRVWRPFSPTTHNP